MKRLGLTQRVELNMDYGERRDCLDQRWFDFAYELGFLPVPLPNVKKSKVPELMVGLGIDALLFTGGNSLEILTPGAEDIAPERDEFESAVLEYALYKEIPVLGVCRGMQKINADLGGKLNMIEGHVGTRHSIVSQTPYYNLPEYVNSFHNWKIRQKDLADILRPIALDDSDNVEAFDTEHARILGVMWHPEREFPFNPLDIKLVKDFYYD